MHIAVLIYGRLNKCSAQYNNIINSIDKNNTLDFFCSSDNSNKADLEEFICKYNPKDYINDKIDLGKENLEFFWKNNKFPETKIDNMIRHFYNKNRVYNLLEKYIKKTNTNYDIIMYLRVDINIYNKFNFEYPKDNTIYIPTGKDYRCGINDQISYGNLSVMKIYSNILNNSKLILEKKLSFVHPEQLTLVNLKLHSLNIVRFNLNYEIVR